MPVTYLRVYACIPCVHVYIMCTLRTYVRMFLSVDAHITSYYVHTCHRRDVHSVKLKEETVARNRNTITVTHLRVGCLDKMCACAYSCLLMNSFIIYATEEMPIVIFFRKR